MLELLMALGVWRFTHMLQFEHGPGHIFERFRNLFFEGGDIDGRPKGTFMPTVLKCFYCLSVWISAPFAAYLSRDGWLLLPVYILSLSAISIFINLVHQKIEG